MLKNLFCRKPAISRMRVLELQNEALRARNARRIEAANADLVRRGVPIRVEISSMYLSREDARAYAYCSVRGLA